MLRLLSYCFIVLFLQACSSAPDTSAILPKVPSGAEALSLSGQPLKASPPNEKMLAKYQEAKTNYEAQPSDVDNIIWYGRRTAYLGRYRKAIQIYSQGLQLHPKDARLYRHRGHRYISIREFDRAIADFEQAATLIKGTKDEIEPDGLPNALNIPISSLHTNIWYHLGLAYYLQHDWENALRAYRQCREAGTNDDNLVSSTHWLYMIHRRMGKEAEADQVLDAISSDLKVIENGNYHKLCLFYKGDINQLELQGGGASEAGSDAISYGIGNWHLYNEEQAKAREVFDKLLQRKSWSSFGFIAAEAEEKPEVK